MNSFREKRVLITGGSSGIGLACAERFVREGARVCIIARKPKGVRSAVAALREISGKSASPLEAGGSTAPPAAGPRIVGYTADVASYRQLKSAYRKCRRDQGVPDIWINCAGFARAGYFNELALHLFYRQTETNYYGAVHGVKAVLPDWIERGTAGAIVNVASVAGYLGVFGFSAYTPTKFALLGFSEALRQELKAHGIRVHVVCPPDTDTPGLRAEAEGKPFETAALSGAANRMDAAAVAGYIVRGLRKNRFMILPNFESRCLYALSRWFPGFTRKVMDWMISRAQKRS